MILFLGDSKPVCKELAAELKKSGELTEYVALDEISFKTWLKRDAQKYKQYSHIVLYRNAINENDIELCELINQYKMIYSTEIVLILDDYSENTIRTLLEMSGTSNICVLSDKDYNLQLNAALTNGIEPVYWLRRLPEENGKAARRKLSKKLIAFVMAIIIIITLAVLYLALSFKKADNDSDNTKITTTTAPMSVTTPPISTESTTTTLQTTSETVTTTPIVTTTTATTTTKTTTPAAAVTTTEKPATTVTTTTTKKVTTTTAKKPAATTTTTTAKKKPTTTTTTKKAATTTKKTTTKAATTTPKVTTTKKTTTTTVTTTTLVPIPLRGLALKTSSPDNTVCIKVGETTTVTPVFTPAQATNKKVTWSSNREDRAVIDQNGVVTGRSPGAVIIQCVADDGGLSAACMIVVTE